MKKSAVLLAAAFALFVCAPRDGQAQGAKKTPESVFQSLAAVFDTELQVELDKYYAAHPELEEGWTKITLKNDGKAEVKEIGDNKGNLAGVYTVSATIRDLKSNELIPTKMAITFRFVGSIWYPNQVAFQNIHLGNTSGPYNIVDPPVEPLWEMTAINNAYNTAVRLKVVSP